MLTKKLQEELPVLLDLFSRECKMKEAFDFLFKSLSIKVTRSNPYSMIALKDKNSLIDVFRAPE